MMYATLRRTLLAIGVATATLAAAGPSSAATVPVYLKVEATTAPLPGGTSASVWAYARCTDDTFTDCQAASVPGPQLLANAGDTLKSLFATRSRRRRRSSSPASPAAGWPRRPPRP